jgi:hypothetical protein
MESFSVDEECKPSIIKTLRLIKGAFVIFFLLAVPILGGLLIGKSLGLIFGTAIGGILLFMYLEYTGKL